MDTQISPISQLLHSLGMTREDLNKRSNEMRQFLTANDSTPTRAPEHTSGYRSRSGSDLHQETRSASSSFSLTRSVSAASTSSKRELSPPSTPVKAEQSDGALPSRAMDSMEIIIERQRQSRKGRKSRREKDRAAPGKSFVPPPSPSPSSTSASAMSLDSFMQARDDRPLSAAGSEATSATTSSEMADPPPITPQKSKYYREHTMNMSNGSARKDVACKTETPTPTKPPTRQYPLVHPQAACYSFPPFATYGQYVPTQYPIPQASTSLLPVTPQTNRIMNPPAILTAGRKIASPLHPPSPMVASSSPPPSSPVPHHVDLVSSPGPMGSSPVKDHDKLPFKLPPGPYSPKKPDLSYAALVGQAILASADHRLTLQEIYDFITIVYPHYKRGETTWMNSIRHVLSTTACFRKVPRDRSVGRTLWAIYDEDLECFKGGGFKKQLCKDIMKQQAEKDKKNKTRKRSDVEDDDAVDSRKPKKARKDFKVTTVTSETTSVSHVPILNPQPSFLIAGTSSHPFFPRPTPHHQPYYESCIPQPQLLPAEVIFPPLPPTAALASRAASSAASDKSKEPTPPPPIEKTVSTSTNASTTSLASSLSMPELSPNRSSSTSPPSSVLASDMDVDMNDAPTQNAKASGSSSIAIVGVDDDAPSSSFNVDDDNVFNSSLLGPVSFWGESPGTASLLQPAVELLNFDAMASDDEEEVGDEKKVAAFKVRLALTYVNYLYRPLSPTPRSRSKGSSSSNPQPLPLKGVERPTTPDNARASSSTVLPSTPPRRVKLSSVRTPISHKGLHMSPSASLAHYKSNLDPPRRLDAPPVLFTSTKAAEGEASSSAQDDVFDPLRTPRRRSTTHSASHVTLAGPFPDTPTRSTPSAYESIFRTPTGSSSFSPFRTPNSRSVLDPNDPRVLLDDELNRQSQLVHDSPGGIFGKGSKLLYDSPGFGDWSSSPGKKYWW
ncbi:forkhead box protein I1 [Coprinopsis sp. MPI-PUGE-AT-0042]|nr:forkhead box protein I1 [Coprinopsis sp. MPI-PUGE-AT-0042]